MFSKACEYGIRASIFIAYKSLNNNRVRLKDIAKEINTPEAFTAKIMQDLARCNIVNSVKGPNGGFEIDQRQINHIKLKHIVEALDGESIFTSCGIGLRQCSNDKPCAIHHKFIEIRASINKMLEETSLVELAIDVKKGDSFLKNIE